MPNQLQRRLSARRGSITAPDPYGAHASINDAPNRTSQSKLTIVRVLSPPPPSPNAPLPQSDAPSSPSASSSSFNVGLSHSLSSRRRRPGSVTGIGSGGIGGAGSPPSADSPPPGRLSFAFSSFGPADGSGDHHRSGSGGPHPSSPTSSPRLRPAPGSPRLSTSGGGHGHGGYVGGYHGTPGKPRLTPDQLVDLARQATNPRTLAQIASHSGVHSAGSSSPGSPVLRPHTPTGGSVGVGSQVAPATFTPLPDDIYLPFLDRPAEVAALISTVPDAKLFALLSQTLPKEYIGPAYESPSSPLPLSSLETSVSPPALSSSVSTTSSSAPLTSPAPFATFPSAVSDPTFLLLLTLPPDPALWTHAHLLTHLTVIDRNYAPDPVWVAAARRCIRTHSELIWERVKGGLGVPPELDVDWDFGKVEYQRALEISSNALYGDDISGGGWAMTGEGAMKRRGSQRKGSLAKRERMDSGARMGERMRRLRAELREGAPKQRLGGPRAEDESALDDDDHDDDVQVPPHLAKRWASLNQGQGGEGGSGTATPTSEFPNRGGVDVLQMGTKTTAFAHRTKTTNESEVAPTGSGVSTKDRKEGDDSAKEGVPADEVGGGMVIGEFEMEAVEGLAEVEAAVRLQVTKASGDDVDGMGVQTVDLGVLGGGEHEDLGVSSLGSASALDDTSALDDESYLSEEDEDEEGSEAGSSGCIEIEPILAPSDLGLGTSNAPPPLSHATKELLEAGVASDVPAAEGVGLGDIMEGEEEEDEEGGEGKPAEDVPAQGVTAQKGDTAEETKGEEGEGREEGEDEEGEGELIDPTQIQGLRISTTPVHAAGWYGAGGGLYVPHHAHAAHLSPNLTDNHSVASPMPLGEGERPESRTLAGGVAAAGGGGEQNLSASTGSLGSQTNIISPPLQRSHSRTSSFSSLSGVSIGPFSRSESCGNLAKEMAMGIQHGHYATGYPSSSLGSAVAQGPGSSYGSDVDGYGSDWSAGATQGSVVGGREGRGEGRLGGGGEEQVGDRKPGEPLFVSNFARLNGCPTLSGPGHQQGKSKASRFKVKRAGRESVPLEKILHGGSRV